MSKNNVIPFPVKKRKAATFKEFAEQILLGNATQAARFLEELFGISGAMAETSAEFFMKKVGENPASLETLFNLRELLVKDQKHDAILVITECFGLSYADAAQVVANLIKSNAAGSVG